MLKSLKCSQTAAMLPIFSRNLSVDEIGERYRLNRAFVVQAVCQPFVCGDCGAMCLQAVCYETRIS